jgi:Tfp pilus assembly protein PilF
MVQRERPNAVYSAKAGKLMASKKSELKKMALAINQAVADQNIPNLTRYLEKALQIDPKNEEYLYNLGVCYFKNNLLDASREMFTKALNINPKDVSVLVNLAKVELESKRMEIALSYIEKGFALDSDNVEVLQTYGSILLHMGKLEQSYVLYQKGLEINPDDPVTLSLLGVYYLYTGNLSRSKEIFIRSWEANPKDKNTLMNLSQIFLQEGNYTQAIEWLEKMLEVHPEVISTHHHLAVIYLGLFEWSKGWSEYAHREVHQLNPGAHKELPQDLFGKRLFIRHEQGLGDELFFLRFLPELKRRGAWIAYMPRPKLYNLLKRSEYIDSLVYEDDELVNIDYHCFVGDLPYLLGIDSIEKIPESLPLNIALNEMRAIESALISHKKPLIGVTWRGGVQKLGYLSKEISLPDLIPYLRRLEGTIVVLQRNPSGEEKELLRNAFGEDWIDASDYNDDLEQMAFLMGVLDSYIAVSNTNVHIAGCIGKQCRILLPFPAEWRWGYGAGAFSPWYRSFPLYRQPAYGADWSEVFERLIGDIQRELLPKEPLQYVRTVIDESVLKIEELIRLEMYAEAELLANTILNIDAYDKRVLFSLAQIYNATQQYEKLLDIVERIKSSEF